jgi:hypothetical protein
MKMSKVTLSIYYVIPQETTVEVDQSVIENYDKTGDVHQLLADCGLFGVEKAFIETDTGEMILDLN